MPTILTKINDPWASVDMVLPVRCFSWIIYTIIQLASGILLSDWTPARINDRREFKSSLSERKMKPANFEILNNEGAECFMVLFVLGRIFVLPHISNWKISAGMTLW